MSKRASSVAIWCVVGRSSAPSMPRPPGGRRAMPRQGPGSSPSVPGRPEGPALQLQQSSGQLDLQAPSSTYTQTHTRADRHTYSYQHAWKYPLSSSLAGSGIVNLCLSCVFSLDVGSVLLLVFGCLWHCFLLVMVVWACCCDYLCGVERWWILFDSASVECGLPLGLVSFFSAIAGFPCCLRAWIMRVRLLTAWMCRLVVRLLISACPLIPTSFQLFFSFFLVYVSSHS
jgi:hypothetical protein